MIRVVELAIISIALAAAAILGFLYFKHMVSVGKQVQQLKTVLQELETTFIYLKPTKYSVCLRIAGVKVTRSLVVADGRVLVVDHVVRIYLGNMHCNCVWYRPWLCFNSYRNCGIIDLTRLPDRYYILHSGLLCNYVDVWVEKYGNVTIVHVS